MAQIKCKSFADLKKALENRVMVAMDMDVKKEVIAKIIDHAVEDVYDKYTPADSELGYDRRGTLEDEDYYEVDKSQRMKLKITPTAPFNPVIKWVDKRSGEIRTGVSSNKGNELAGLVNYGEGWHGYSYEFLNEDNTEALAGGRPFLTNAYNELAEGEYVAILGEALEKNGLNVIYK